MALALPVRSEGSDSNPQRWGSVVRGALLALMAALAGSAGDARASSISIDPAFSLCSPSSCGSLTVQLNLGLGEIDADSFGFDIHVDDAPLIGLSVGPVPGNPLATMSGTSTFNLLPDGTTLRGQLTTGGNPNFDGPGIFDLAVIPLSANGEGTVTFTFLSAEIRCETCNGGAGQEYAATNSSGGFLAQVTVIPEPGSFGLLALGLTALGARRRRHHREGGIR